MFKKLVLNSDLLRRVYIFSECNIVFACIPIITFRYVINFHLNQLFYKMIMISLS